MGLRYIFGGPGSGKTTKCFNEIYEMTGAVTASLIYIVPEQFSLQAEKKLALRFEGKAVIKAQVLSFNRLAYNIFSENGTEASALLDRTGKAMLIRRVLSNVSDTLTYYKNVSVTNGFIENISSAITEFRQYDVNMDKLKVFDDNSALKFKIQDLCLIFEEYERLASGYLSPDDTLDMLTERIHSSEFLRGAYIWIDNFSGFTPQEYKVLGALMNRAQNVNICINLNDAAIYYEKLSQADPLYELKNTVNKITAIANDTKTALDGHICLKDSMRYSLSPEIMYLKDNFNRYSAERFAGGNSRVKLGRFKNKYDEIEAAAILIYSMVREQGYSYSDIAMLSGNIYDYDKEVESVFQKYGIPVFVDKRIDLVNHPLSEYIRSLIRIVVDNWSYESVFNFLKTGLTSFDVNEIDVLENYVIAYGIRGDMWRNKKYWKYGFGEKGRYDEGEIHGIRDRVYDYISFFTGKYTKDRKKGVTGICLDIYRFLIDMDIPKKIEALCQSAMERNDVRLYRKHFSIWGNIIAVLERLADIFGEEKFKFSEFAAIFEAGLLSSDMGIIPPSQDQVIFGDLYRSRFDEIKALIVLGATNDNFPKIEKESGLFDDNERAVVEKTGVPLGPGNVRKTNLNGYLSYQAVVKASDYLYIFCPEMDLDWNPVTPSGVFEKIDKMLSDAYIDKSLLEEYISSSEAMFRKAVMHAVELKAGGKPDAGSQALYNWYLRKGEYGQILSSIEKDDYYGNERLSKDIIDGLYGENVKTSVSRLEKYNECPFSFFVKYDLLAEERQVYQIQRVDLGNLFHDILEIFARYVRIKGLDWGRLNYQQVSELVDLAYNELNETRNSDLFINEARSRFILERTRQIARTSVWALCRHVSAGEFKPLESELDFGITSPVTGIEIEIGGGRKFTLTGRIDRIDVLDAEGNTYVKIIDYKTGSTKFDITDIYYGMQLQLLLYMNALVKNGARILNIRSNPKPGGMFYFSIQNPVVEYAGEVKESRLNEMLLEQFKMSGLLLNNSAVIEGMDGKFEKNSPVIPVSVNSKGEYSSRTKSLADDGEFSQAMSFAESKVKEIGVRIMSGDIEPIPYKQGAYSGCGYCSYNAICGFEPGNGKFRYNYHYKKSGLGDLKI